MVWPVRQRRIERRVAERGKTSGQLGLSSIAHPVHIGHGQRGSRRSRLAPGRLCEMAGRKSTSFIGRRSGRWSGGSDRMLHYLQGADHYSFPIMISGEETRDKDSSDR